MKYFTPELYTRLQQPGPEEMDAADVAWEDAVRLYEEHLQAVRPELPEAVRHLLDDCYLHDADVLSMGRQGGTFVVVLRLAVPPHNLLVLTYDLTGAPAIDTAALPGEVRSPRVQWLFDEIGRVTGDPAAYTHMILLSNGWQVCLTFQAVHVLAAQALLPVPTAAEPARQSA